MRLEPLEYRLLLSSGPLWISEFMANNTKTLKDQDGAYSDWLEINNPGTAPVNLGGWSLTDSATNLKMWQFPSEDLQAGQYLVVFASGKDRAVAGSELHTNFTLTPSGGYLALVEPDGKTITDAYSPQYPAQVADISYGWSQDLTTQGYFTSPSPGMANIGQPIPNVAQQVIVNELMYHPGFGDPGYPGYVAEDTMKQWVELYNKGTTAVDLSNWQLTQGAKYTFPSGTSIAAGGYLVVAADPATFHATYPSVSNYVGGVTLVAPAATAEALVPTSAALGTTWTGINFTETGWTSGTTGVGYQQDTTYQGLIGLNVGTAMYTHNTSVYARALYGERSLVVHHPALAHEVRRRVRGLFERRASGQRQRARVAVLELRGHRRASRRPGRPVRRLRHLGQLVGPRVRNERSGDPGDGHRGIRCPHADLARAGGQLLGRKARRGRRHGDAQ